MAVKDNIIIEKGEVAALTPEELLWKIDKIDSLNGVRDRAFVAFLYLTAARVEEVCYYILEIRKANKKVDGEVKSVQVVEEREYSGDPIKKDQVVIYGEDEKKVEIMGVRCLKRQVAAKRNVPIYINDLERPFYDYFKKYLKTLESDDFLFPFTRQRATQILEKIDLYPHLVRHTRLTHLATYYGFTPSFLKDYTGWTSISPANIYVHLRTVDLFNVFKHGYKRGKE